MNSNSLHWKTLESDYIFYDKWLKARRDKCERPDGKVVYPYYVMEYPNWVTAVALTEDEKVVLVRQYRHALGEECIEIPGGCVDASDENLEAAVRRELLEETGYVFEKAEYLGRSSSNPSINSNSLHMFLLTGGQKVQEQELDGNEEIHVELVSLEEFKQMFSENKFVQSMHVANIFYALQKLNKLQVI